MKTRNIFLTMLMLALVIPAQAQLGKKLLEKAKETVEKVADEKAPETSQTASGESQISTKNLLGSTLTKATKTIYVSEANGSNRNDGSKSSPLKDIQKAVNDAPEGALIQVAQGNYLGNLDRGYIEIKKYISIVGGYSDDFSERDPIKYRTMIQPPANAGGTNANYGLLDIYVKGNRNGVVLIDGFFLDKGFMNRYRINDSSNPKTGTPEGCETGLMVPPGFDSGIPTMRAPTSVSGQLMHGDVEGQVTIRNCVFMNGCHFGIQMGNLGGHFDIYNNIFLANRMAACEVRSMNKNEIGRASCRERV